MTVPSENAVRVALLVQQLRDEGKSDTQAVREVARALGITEAAVAAAVHVVRT